MEQVQLSKTHRMKREGFTDRKYVQRAQAGMCVEILRTCEKSRAAEAARGDGE